MYQIMAILGIFAAGIYVCRICKKTGHDDNEAIIFLLTISVGALTGGSLLYLTVNIRNVIVILNNVSFTSFRVFFDVFRILFGGSVFYGGLLGGILTAIIFVYKQPHYRYLVNITAPAIPLFHFFGRLGCFLGGCCYGIECTFGFTAQHSLLEEANGVSRFPVQLLEALFNIILFFILDCFRRKNIFKQRLIFIYLLSYSAGRFLIEFLRGDAYRGFFLGLSTSQIISVLMFCSVAVFCACTCKHKDNGKKEKLKS